MPTLRPRHQITETPAVARAIDIAAERWPGEPRSRLVRRLLELGGNALDHAENRIADDRRHAILATSGKYADAFRADFLPELREDWPA